MSLPTVFTVAITNIEQGLHIIKMYPPNLTHLKLTEKDINYWLRSSLGVMAMVVKNGKFRGCGKRNGWEETYRDVYGKIYEYKEFMQMLKENGESVHKKLRGAK